MDLWPWTVEARRSLLSTFEQLDDNQWSAQSLSEGWRVRDVLAHLIFAARPPVRGYMAALARSRGNFDTANHSLAIAGGQRPVADLLNEYRDVVEHRFSPPGWPQAAPLGDILLHSLDVRIPLGLPTDHPAEHYEPAAQLLFSRVGRSFTRTGRPDVCWVATDLDWTQGDGPEVSGTMVDVALAAAGRGARIDHLSGDGVTAVRSWLA